MIIEMVMGEKENGAIEMRTDMAGMGTRMDAIRITMIENMIMDTGIVIIVELEQVEALMNIIMVQEVEALAETEILLMLTVVNIHPGILFYYCQ